MLSYFVPHYGRLYKNLIRLPAGRDYFRRNKPVYAIIQSGGKQYKVTAGESISVEKLNAVPGDKINFDVLMTSSDEGKISAGTPFVEGAAVTGEVVEQYKSSKLTIYTYKPKIHVRKKQGHRQPYTLVKITDIKL